MKSCFGCGLWVFGYVGFTNPYWVVQCTMLFFINIYICIYDNFYIFSEDEEGKVVRQTLLKSANETCRYLLILYLFNIFLNYIFDPLWPLRPILWRHADMTIIWMVIHYFKQDMLYPCYIELPCTQDKAWWAVATHQGRGGLPPLRQQGAHRKVNILYVP